MGRYARQGCFMRPGQCGVKESCIAQRNWESNLQLIQLYTSNGFASVSSFCVSLTLILYMFFFSLLFHYRQDYKYCCKGYNVGEVGALWSTMRQKTNGLVKNCISMKCSLLLYVYLFLLLFVFLISEMFLLLWISLYNIYSPQLSINIIFKMFMNTLCMQVSLKPSIKTILNSLSIYFLFFIL